MAITNFIPEIWTAGLLTALRDQLAYAQDGVINRQYEGEISRFGDTVHITSFEDPEDRAYTRNSTTVTYDGLTDEDTALVINQSRYFAFKVDDLDRKQALPGFVEEATTGASHSLVKRADGYVSGLMSANAGNEVDATTITDPADAYDLLVEFRTKLKRSNTPDIGRWAAVPPEFYALLLKDDRFVDASASGSTDALRNGRVGAAAGFTIIEANTTPETDGVFDVMGGHGIATTYAEQIVDVEALRLETAFADGIRGLHLYGAKVVRPECLVKCEVTVGTASA